jgi:secreted PhoX family phosphatase
MTDNDRSDAEPGFPYTRRDALAVLTTGLLGLRASGTAAADHDASHEHDEDAPSLTRLATMAAGSEVTGLFVTRHGDLFVNQQDPSDDNPAPFDRGAIGVVDGLDTRELPEEFPSQPVPEGAERRRVQTARGDYRVLANGGDPVTNGTDGERLGVAYSVDGDPMTTGQDADFNGFVPGDDPDTGYLFTNYESKPGMVSRLTLRRRDGRWRVVASRNLGFRAEDVQGTWHNCFGTVSPWGTPLSAEEYDSYAAAWYQSAEAREAAGYDDPEIYRAYLGYWGNPYRYGYVVEVEQPTSDNPTPKKRYAMGSCAPENAVVMPDERTVYFGDDGSGTTFYKFVADEPRDLTSGTLSAAKAIQEPGRDAASVGFALEWIELAHGHEEQVESWVAEYDRQEPGPTADYVTPAEVAAWAAGDAPDDRAAFLETRLAATMTGATAEFNKMEGVNVRPDAEPGDYLYVAMSTIEGTMSDDAGDIRVSENGDGIVYRLQLDEHFDVDWMEPAVVGGPDANVCGGCPYDASPAAGSEVCRDCSYNPGNADDGDGLLGTDPLTTDSTAVDRRNAISHPDNVVVMADGRVLIGEDNGHQNDMLWVYNPGRDVDG